MNIRILETIDQVYNHPTLRSVLTKLRYLIFIILFLLFIPRVKPDLFLPGFLVSLFGELIQLWSFASLDKNRTLAIKGPYGVTRNPMYLGRFFLLLGCLLLMGNLWILLVFAVLYYFYMVNRVKREESSLQLQFGETYATYSREVNRFVPSLKGLDRRSLLFFKVRLLFQNHGHWNLLAVLACYALFYFFTFKR